MLRQKFENPTRDCHTAEAPQKGTAVHVNLE